LAAGERHVDPQTGKIAGQFAEITGTQNRPANQKTARNSLRLSVQFLSLAGQKPGLFVYGHRDQKAANSICQRSDFELKLSVIGFTECPRSLVQHKADGVDYYRRERQNSCYWPGKSPGRFLSVAINIKRQAI
jgi:hypothetical protein